jgi:class 3 adenylate cyclase/tetratricopeptide (TPR) repeat protein
MVVCPACGEENPDRFRLCGFCGTPLVPPTAAHEERRTVTVLFSDLQGSTRIGEALDPESVREVMSRYFDAMTGVIRRHGGTVEKFIGDAIMAVFGLPKIHEDDALRAVRAAHETQAALATLNADLERVYGVSLTNRTGVNTGEVVSGDPTTGQRLVTGDTVNTAARLEQAAPPNEVLLGDLTWRLVRDAVEVEPVEPLTLKGKADPIPAYRLVAVAMHGEGIARRETAPMVGREGELARLQALFAEATAARACRVATIIGDAGIGKSRLVREFVGRLARDAQVLRGKCLPYGEGITFWPLTEALRGSAGIAPDDPPDVASSKLAEFVVDREVAVRMESILGFGTRQFSVDELFWGVRRWLEGLAELGPVVWVIDDIHWAERTLLDLIVNLTGTVQAAPLVLVCTARHELLQRQPDWGTDVGERLMLNALGEDDVSGIIRNLLGRTGIPDSVQHRIAEAAEGNPLFVEQLLSMLVDTGQLQPDDGRWIVSGALDTLEVPPTIQALLAARLDLLERDERAVVEPASVIGVEFAVPAVEELVSEADRQNVPTHLVSMASKQLVRPTARAVIDADAYRFGHILIRDAAYAGILKRRRADLHERFVAWADRVNAQRDQAAAFEEILGYHLEQAYRYLSELGPLDAHGRDLGTRASERLAAAGRRAMTRGDMPAAVSLLSRASATLPDEDERRIALLIDLAEALTEVGRFADAKVELDAAESAATAAGTSRLVFRARLVRLVLLYYTGEDPEWGAHVGAETERALRAFGDAEDQLGLALAWRLRFGAAALALRFGDATDAAEEVVSHAQVAMDRRYEARGAAGFASAVLLGPTPVEEAIARCRRLLAIVEGDRRTTALIRAAMAQLAAMTGQIDEARSLISLAADELREVGSTLLASSRSIDAARIELLAGDLHAAERLLRIDHDALTEIGEQYYLSTVDGLLARVLYELDRFDEAAELAVAVKAMASEEDLDAQALWRQVLAMIRARRGETAEALTLGHEAVELYRRSDAPVLLADSLVDFGEVLRFAGRDDEARAARTEALRLYESKGDLVSSARLRSLLS